MALIGNNADTFLNGLSDFWHRFFRDIGDVQAVYEGTAVLMGQVYLDLLNDVLSISVDETPLFRKEYYKVLAIREDQVQYRDTGVSASSRHVYTGLTEDFASAPMLQNRIFNPTAALEQDIDYEVVDGELRFLGDPAQSAPAGFASRQVDVAVGGVFRAPTGVSDFLAAGVQKGDRLYLSHRTSIRTGAVPGDLTPLTVVHVAPDRLAVSSATPLPRFPAGFQPTNFSWRVRRLLTTGAEVDVMASPFFPDPFDGRIEYLPAITVTEVSYWVVDAKIDDKRLYRNVGHLFGGERASTEAYRTFLRGLMQLYVTGPAIDRVESALNVTANFPVVREDGEVLLEVITDATTRTVITTRNSYEYPLSIPLRTDVLSALNWGTLSFRAFETLTTAIRVVDHVKDPDWWHNITIPQNVLPEYSSDRRQVTPALLPNVVGPGSYVGDIGFFVGADETGAVVPVPYRHNGAYIIMNQLLKYHLFSVVIDPAVELTGTLIRDLQDLVLDVKPAHTAVYFDPPLA